MRMHYHDGLLTGTCTCVCTQGVHVGSRVSLGSLRQPLVRELFSRPVVGQGTGQFALDATDGVVETWRVREEGLVGRA